MTDTQPSEALPFRYRVSGMDCAKDAAQIERAAQAAGIAPNAVKVPFVHSGYSTLHPPSPARSRPPDKFARGVAVSGQCLKPHTVVGGQIQANVIASHAFSMTQPETAGNLLSGEEH